MLYPVWMIPTLTSYIPITLLPYLTLPPANNSLRKRIQLLAEFNIVVLFIKYLDLDLERLPLFDLDLLLDELECLLPLPLLDDLELDLLYFPLLLSLLLLLDLEEELELELK